MNTKLHAVTDTSGRPIRFFITAGQVSVYTGAMALLSSLPVADWFREVLVDRSMKPCIPGRKSRNKVVRYDQRRYRRRNRNILVMSPDPRRPVGRALRSTKSRPSNRVRGTSGLRGMDTTGLLQKRQSAFCRRRPHRPKCVRTYAIR